jgi:hypothetical protein
MLVCVMAEVLEGLFQINLNFVEGLDGVNPAHDISAQVSLNRDLPAHLGGWGGPNLTVSAVAMMDGWFTMVAG